MTTPTTSQSQVTSTNQSQPTLIENNDNIDGEVTDLNTQVTNQQQLNNENENEYEDANENDNENARAMGDRANLKPFEYRGSASTLGLRFEQYLELFDMALVVNKITKDEEKKAYLLLNIGEQLYQVYAATKKGDESYTAIREMLQKHLRSKTVVFTEVSVFRRATRLQDETIQEYAIRLRNLAKNCDYGDRTEKEILQQFIMTVGNSEIERKCCLKGLIGAYTRDGHRNRYQLRGPGRQPPRSPQAY